MLSDWALFLVVCLSIGAVHFWYSTRKISFHGPEHRVGGDFNSLTSALNMYQVVQGSYPTDEQGLRVLVDQPSESPKSPRWSKLMEVVPNDPWGRAYRYQRRGGGFELSSDGKDGVSGTNDDLSDFRD